MSDDAAVISEAMKYVEGCAPNDVLSTLSWLGTNDWQPVNAQGGSSESFGNVLVEFAKDDGRITITRDRSQWLMSLRPSGWSDKFDLDIVLDTINGRDDWQAGEPFARPLPEQLPPGVSWAETLPQALEWLSSHDDGARVLKRIQLKRSRSLFPGARRERR
jgi:hypothetical protein